jgi:hypothetical protein
LLFLKPRLLACRFISLTKALSKLLWSCESTRRDPPQRVTPKPTEQRIKPQELNYLKMMMRMPKPSALLHRPGQEPPNEKPNPEDEKLIVISSLKTPEEQAEGSDHSRHFRVHKKLKRYISN